MGRFLVGVIVPPWVVKRGPAETVRYLERRPRHSFWLPTPQDRFYPDFVAELNDGRYLVVEYKGEHLADGKDTEQKDALGRLWADRSNGLCLFYLATRENLSGLQRHIQGR